LEWCAVVSVSLVIDTATARTIVGIVRDSEILWQGFHDGATDHGNAVADLVKQALAAGVNPDRVVVGMGPGPFTGLRVGIAFARAFAAARNIEVIGVCSLDAIAVGEDEYTVAIDARRKEIYWARYKDGIRVEGPAVNFPADIAGYILDLYPDITRLVELSADQNYTEPFYLRRPDAVATADRT
jgi:tRNA threonylcarbamoyl adenosine modification protein YeaZ